jgi:hypothetical protein
VIVVTGLLAEGRTGGAGRFSELLSRGAVAVVGDIHAWLGFFIIWLAGAHVAGVVFESLLHRENLVRTMITGRRQAADQRCADARLAPMWRAVLLAVVLGVLGVWLAVGTRVPAVPAMAVVHGR